VSLPEDLCCWVHLAECSLACKLNHGMSPVSFQQVTINRCTLWDIVVTVYTNSFNIKNFYLRFTQFIYIYCVYLWTNKDDFPIHDSIIGFSTETESVYCAVRAECLNINQVNPRLSTRRTVFDSMSAYVSFGCAWSGTGRPTRREDNMKMNLRGNWVERSARGSSDLE